MRRMRHWNRHSFTIPHQPSSSHRRQGAARRRRIVTAQGAIVSLTVAFAALTAMTARSATRRRNARRDDGKKSPPAGPGGPPPTGGDGSAEAEDRPPRTGAFVRFEEGLEEEDAPNAAGSGSVSGTGGRLSARGITDRAVADAASAIGRPSPDRYPPIGDLLTPNGTQIRPGADVSWLLDFSIVGLPKCGTTALLRHLSESGMADVLEGERCDLVVGDAAKVVRALYEELPHAIGPVVGDGGGGGGGGGGRRPRGMKCPQDVSSASSLPNYERHFPRTRLVVGIRHPLRLFQSLYNFRLMTMPGQPILPPNNLTKRCIRGSLGVCAWRANLADFLSRLGKTPLDTPEERELMTQEYPPHRVGEVFLYDMGQLGDANETRAARFRADLGSFLGLGGDLGPIPRFDAGHVVKVFVHREDVQRRRVDLCDPEHGRIRGVLLDKARRASRWIRRYFLESEEVVVSSREFLVETLEGWMRDPCREKLQHGD